MVQHLDIIYTNVEKKNKPPNGKDSTVIFNKTSLTIAPPDVVLERTLSLNFEFREKV